jgi:hypothetical protein
LSPDDQKFVVDVENQFPAITGAIAADPSFTAGTLAAEGEAVCTAFSLDRAQGDVGTPVYENIASGFANHNLPGPGKVVSLMIIPGVGSNNNSVVTLAIEDLCPTYLSDIPPGYPGAS